MKRNLVITINTMIDGMNQAGSRSFFAEVSSNKKIFDLGHTGMCYRDYYTL
jgi:hypothetical protein